jgi:hypothetical protein
MYIYELASDHCLSSAYAGGGNFLVFLKQCEDKEGRREGRSKEEKNKREREEEEEEKGKIMKKKGKITFSVPHMLSEINLPLTLYREREGEKEEEKEEGREGRNKKRKKKKRKRGGRGRKRLQSSLLIGEYLH